MLRFVFAALVVILDQFFKRWIVITLELHENIAIIPGVIGLTRVENTGAAFSILADQRWLLAAIAFLAAIVFVFILLRYNEGFWGALGLAAVLGGTVGNMIDRIFSGHVIDMFRTEFIDFAIFNIADIFITLGALTFCVYFIYSSATSKKSPDAHIGRVAAGYTEEMYGQYESDDETGMSDYGDFSDTKVFPSRPHGQRPVTPPGDYMPGPEPPAYSDDTSEQPFYSDPALEQPDNTSSVLDVFAAIESELDDLDAINDYDLDNVLREYGFEDDKGPE